MGGFFGAVSKENCVLDVFYGIDYHSHLGTRRAGIAAWEPRTGFQREIHNVENSPFRTKFQGIEDEVRGNIALGGISDLAPQPLLMRSNLGVFSIWIEGSFVEKEELVSEVLNRGGNHFETMGSGKVNPAELVGALISQKDNFVDGILYAQKLIDRTLSILIMTKDKMIVARDKQGRIPMILGKNEKGYCVSFESFAFEKVGYKFAYELGPGEVVEFDSDGYKQLAEPNKDLKICTFLWVYQGYPNATYEGVNVEVMRNRNGELMVLNEDPEILDRVDIVSGVPDSGLPHAIGYSNQSKIPFARPFVKYTPTWPRSFIPANQSERDRVAKMKIVPVKELIKGKNIILIDDSIVRGTQLRNTVNLLYQNGVKELHVRVASPPCMHFCTCLSPNKLKEEDLLTRRIINKLEGKRGNLYIDEYSDPTTKRAKNMREEICREYGFSSLEFQRLDSMIEAIGLDRKHLCTYSWDGK